MAELPAALQNELQHYINIKPISKLRLFQGVTQECLKEIAEQLEKSFFAPGDQVIRKGDPGNEMYVIGHGDVNVHNGDHHIATLAEGSCFGEMSLVQSETRNADVTAKSYCDLYILSKDKFHTLAKKHEILRANVDLIMQERQKSA